MSDLTADAGPPDTPDATTAAPRRVAPYIVLVVAVVLGVFFVVLVRAKADNNTDSADTPLLGKPAPAVHTTTLDGKTFDLQRRKGSWVVLNFFNSTCVPCVQEHPELVKYAQEQAALGTDATELYTVSWTDDLNNVKAFFAKNGGTWPVLTDSDASVAVAFGVAKVPETWIVNPDGIVVFRTINTVTADSLSRRVAALKTLYDQAAG